MKHRVLLIDNNRIFVANLKELLMRNEVEVDWTEQQFKASSMIYLSRYSVIMVAHQDRGINGFDICGEMRANEVSTHVVLVTEKLDQAMLARGLKAGADIVVPRGVGVELMALQLMRFAARMGGKPHERIILGNIEINKTTREVKSSGKQVTLQRREFDILLLLADNRGRPIRKELINKMTCSKYYEGGLSSIDVHISKLRQKLRSHDLIKTVHGVGYKVC